MIIVGLDRDGTLIEDIGYLGRNENWRDEIRPYFGVVEGIRELKEIPNLKIVIMTNQPGVARGYYNERRVREINDYIIKNFAIRGVVIDACFYCPFVPRWYALERGINDGKYIKDSKDRKPGIGMVKKATKLFEKNLDEIIFYMFGDRLSDVETGLNANGRSIFIFNGENSVEKMKVIKNFGNNDGVYIAHSFLKGVEWVKNSV